jgi:hypothetical protein
LHSVTPQFAGSFSQNGVIGIPAGVPAQMISSLTAMANVLIFGVANFTNQIMDISGSQNLISLPVGTLTLVYAYTKTPETGTVGVAMAGLAYRRRKR